MKNITLGDSFCCALKGLGHLWTRERNLRVQLVCFLGMLLLACWLGCTPGEWATLMLASGLVFTAEGVNTAIEILADRVTLERDEAIGRSKDVAAGAVLLAAITALVTGTWILAPKIWSHLN